MWRQTVKENEYKSLKANLMPTYDEVHFSNMSIGACELIENESKTCLNFYDV